MKTSRKLLVSIFSVVSAAAAAQAPVVDANSTDIEGRLAAIESILDTRTESQHRIQSQLDIMQQEIDELRGALEVHTNQLEKILQRQRELYLEIDKRVEALKATASVSVPVQGTGGVTPSQSSGVDTVGAQATGNETESYEAAVNLILKDRDYARAVPAFQAFLRQYPDSQYSANAHYWLGQLLFNQQEWANAQQQFAIVVDRFPDSSKRADSILKMGIIAQRQGNEALARQLFNRVISEYPDSSARNLAENRIGQLGG